MITQKAMCLKLDVNTLEQLDKEASLGWKSRNRIINDAVSLYLELQDHKRRVRSYQSMSDKEDEVRKFIRKQFPGIIGGEIIKSIYQLKDRRS